VKTATLLLFALLAATPLAAQTSSAAQPEDSLVVVGILKNALGEPVVGETVCFSVLTDGRASLKWAVKDGKTTGVLNPQVKTDTQGRFRIEVSPDQLGDGKSFTLGNSQRWFARAVFDVPAKPTKAGKREVDVGTVVR
jgi:hypothetical protein